MSENDPNAIHIEEIRALLVTPLAITIIAVLSVMILLCCFGCFWSCEIDKQRNRLNIVF